MGALDTGDDPRGLEVPDDLADDHLVAETLGGTSRNIASTVPRSADMYRPHPYTPSGLPGTIGAPCLMCGGGPGAPQHEDFAEKALPFGELRVQVIKEDNEIRIQVDNPPTAEAERILMRTLPKVLEKFLTKNKDYGDGDEMRCLGAKAEFVRLWNKAAKLKRAIWDGEPLTGEQPDEIMSDMIGHLLLALTRAEE